MSIDFSDIMMTADKTHCKVKIVSLRLFKCVKEIDLSFCNLKYIAYFLQKISLLIYTEMVGTTVVISKTEVFFIHMDIVLFISKKNVSTQCL